MGLSTINLLIAFALVIITSFVWYFKQVISVRNRLDWVKRVPGYPLIGNALDFTKGPTHFLTQLSEYIKTYGKIVYVQISIQNLLVVTDYKFLEHVLSSNSLSVLSKSQNYKFLNNWIGTGLLTSGGSKWKSRRKIITPAFHFQILEEFVEIFEKQVDILVNKFEQYVDKDELNVYPFVSLCALDVICETAMGTSINAQTNSTLDYITATKQMCKIIVDRSFSPVEMFDTLYPLTKNYWREKRALKIIHKHTKAVIESRKKELKNRQTDTNLVDDIGVKKKVAFLDLLLQSTIDGKPLSEEDIHEEVDTFMFEGHDTTSSAISFALYCLAKYPDVQKQAFDEVATVLGYKEKECTYRDLQEMKYMEHVIKEVLRQYPSVPFYAREVINDFNYNGKIIPKNTSILIYAYGVNNDPDNFPSPEKFDPTRFRDLEGTAPYSYLPFSAGPRNCIGQKFAMLEIKSFISCILKNFELIYCPEREVVLSAETVLMPKTGIYIKLKRRQW